jgi:hypothetical protein
MRIGFADRSFSTPFLAVLVSIIVFLAIWTFRELPKNGFRWLSFTAVYLTAGLVYTNPGVWLHEHLHCLVYRGRERNRTNIHFSRRKFFFLDGHYRVQGSIDYLTNRHALLMPIILVAAFVLLGLSGNWFLPGWWLPVMLTLAAASLMDMIHDFYMVLKIRQIGENGKYWDTGKYMEVVWKEQAEL